MPRSYNAPANGVPSQVGDQLNEFKWLRNSIIDLQKEQYFGQLSGTIDMPKNMGKAVTKYHYLPMLDDRNVNDQGIDATGATIANGNLYGSSKDVGTIQSKLPVVGEHGGRVNRVGFSRVLIEGSIDRMGFFDEYTQDSVQFDTDEDLMQHVYREMMRGANEIQEDVLQIELLNSAGIVMYGGAATQDSEVTAEGSMPSTLDYADLVRMSRTLDDNRTPRKTTLITGSRMTDTKTVPGARYLMAGSAMDITFERMKDLHGERAFIPVEKYGAAATLARGETGALGKFRVIQVPEMMAWEGAGASVSDNPGYQETGGKYDIHPLLVVGDGSFTNIGFQMSGTNSKVSIIHKKPGKETADRNDPYGQTGFMSIMWFHGILIERPERILLYKTIAEA